MDGTLEVVGFAGSLRSGSLNRALLRAAIDRAPPSVEIQNFELDDVPLYNGDVEDRGDPDAVVELKEAIDAADGLLIVTPEYNHGVPAVTKNAVDWASRPPERVLSQKPVAIAGATPSQTGTARGERLAQDALPAVNAFTMQSPGFLMARAHDKIEDREVIDESTLEFLSDFLDSFEAWVRRFTE
jgi:chromate reductase